MKKYPVVTLCGSTRFKDEFIHAQTEFTLKGYIVISVCRFAYAGDEEVWKGLDEHALTNTKIMLDDMDKTKIDLADEIYVINPNGYIGDSTWTEICYAYMTDKSIYSMEPIDMKKVEKKVRTRKRLAELHAARQYDIWSHLASDYPADYLLNEMVTIKKGKYTTVDPWIPVDDTVPVCDYPYIGHADQNSGYDPFKVYGKQKMARFVEKILLKSKMEAEKKPTRCEMMEEIQWYCNQLGMPLPKGYPHEMRDEEMKNWIECWEEFDPCPDI